MTIKMYTTLVWLALLIVVGLQLWLGMPILVVIPIVLVLIVIARSPFNADAKLLFYATVLGLVLAVPIIKYTFNVSALAAIAIAVVAVPVVAFNCLPQMSYSLGADLALKHLAQDLRLELVSEDHGILDVAGVWVYNWPKMAVLYESQHSLEQAEASGLVDKLGHRFADIVRSDPAYGRGRKSFDPKQAVWCVTEMEQWENIVAKRSCP
jgi:hypothetical protein